MRFTKKMFAMFLALLLASTALTATASSGNDDVTVTIDGVAVEFEGQEPMIVGGRTLVPVRGVFEILGFYPAWSRTAQTATLTRDDYVVVLTIGSYEFTTNGEVFTLDVPAQLIGGRTLLPLRAVLESVGYDDMTWISATSTVVIRTGIDDEPEPVATPTPTPIPSSPTAEPVATPTPTPSPTPVPVATPTPTPSPAPEPTEQSPLVGTWRLFGIDFYVFEADGTGTMGSGVIDDPLEFGWRTSNGILYMCFTPGVCQGRDECIAPLPYYYTIEGNTLTLESVLIPGTPSTYTRR